MVLTSIPHRRCTPKKNRRIPTIPTGNIDSRLVHVSTVVTGPRRNESGALGGTARRLRHRSAPPSCPLPARGPVEGRPFEITDMAPPPAPCAGSRRSWFDAGSALSLASSRSTPRGSGSTGHGLCVLHEGPTYPQYPQPSSSSTPPSCSASRRRRQPPQSPGHPSPTGPSSSSPLWQTHPTGVLRSHDIRNSQKT